MESRTPNLDKFKSKLMEREMARKISKMDRPSKVETPKMELKQKPSMKEVTVGEAADKSFGKQLSRNLERFRNDEEMLPKRVAGTQYGLGGGEGPLPKSMSNKQVFKELGIREWADRAERKNNSSAARGKKLASNNQKLKDYWNN
jgi:hypothetical protein